MDIAKLRDPIIAEEATGIKQSGKLELWSKGKVISRKKARQNVMSGEEVAVPGAGAGSYYKIFEMLGFSELKPLVLSSSAGDWSFGVKDKTGWRLASQENRYPYKGFRYYVDNEELWGFTDFQDLVDTSMRE